MFEEEGGSQSPQTSQGSQSLAFVVGWLLATVLLGVVHVVLDLNRRIRPVGYWISTWIALHVQKRYFKIALDVRDATLAAIKWIKSYITEDNIIV